LNPVFAFVISLSVFALTRSLIILYPVEVSYDGYFKSDIGGKMLGNCILASIPGLSPDHINNHKITKLYCYILIASILNIAKFSVF